MRLTYFTILVILLGSSCKKKCDSPGESCNEKLRPVIMVHGFLASGDTWASQAQRFASNGYCNNRIFVFDWNTLSQGGQAYNIVRLDSFVDAVLSYTASSKVDLIGHSAGGGLGYNYCSDATRAAKIAKYVHVGSSSQSKPAGPNGEIPTLCLSSPDDKVTGASTVTDAININIANKDHYEIATSKESFIKIYLFLNDETPGQDIVADQLIKVSGKMLMLGENTPLADAEVSVYELKTADGTRVSTDPQFKVKTALDGRFPELVLKKNTYYEFQAKSSDPNDRVVHYFREPFVKSDHNVYLRMLPKTGIASILLGGLPKDDRQSVLAVFTANQAVVNGRDQLFVDNVELSTAAISPASATNIAFFCYDENQNQQSDLTEPAVFGLLSSFLSGVDVFFPTTPARSIHLRFNGRSMYAPSLKSETDGVMVAVFN